MRKILYIVAFLLALLAPRAVAQEPTAAAKPTFYIFVDTAGVTAVAPDTYIAWIFATSVPHPTPMVSSAIQVAFDCKGHKVARQYHVVYHLQEDSLGVIGPIEEDPGEWVEPQARYANMFNMVCEVGATRPYVEELETPEPEQQMPGPDPSRLYPIS